MRGQRLSVAMCVYNGAGYIREQLDSIAAQHRLPDELVVCDDHSFDRTPEIVEVFASKVAFPVRIFVNEKNLGYTKNIEKAISLTAGDIIFPCDHDDVWRPDKLKHIEAIFLNSPHVGAVFSNADIVDERLNPLGLSLWQSANFSRSRQKRFTRGRAFEVLLGGNVAYGATMAFRAAFKDLVLPISSAWDADEWIALLVSTKAELAVVHQPLIKYRQHSTNLSGGAAGKKTITEQLNRVRRQPERTAFYSRMIDQYRLVHERLLAAGSACDSKDIWSLEAKIKHLHARAGMKAGPPRRLPNVLRELVTLRYHRYSSGWKSAATDLLL